MVVSLPISTTSNVVTSVPDNYFLELNVQVEAVAVTASLKIPMLVVSHLLKDVTKNTFVMERLSFVKTRDTTEEFDATGIPMECVKGTCKDKCYTNCFDHGTCQKKPKKSYKGFFDHTCVCDIQGMVLSNSCWINV